jgi:hypothetical protein
MTNITNSCSALRWKFNKYLHYQWLLYTYWKTLTIKRTASSPPQTFISVYSSRAPTTYCNINFWKKKPLLGEDVVQEICCYLRNVKWLSANKGASSRTSCIIHVTKCNSWPQNLQPLSVTYYPVLPISSGRRWVQRNLEHPRNADPFSR